VAWRDAFFDAGSFAFFCLAWLGRDGVVGAAGAARVVGSAAREEDGIDAA
jgi:hypothetical protein